MQKLENVPVTLAGATTKQSSESTLLYHLPPAVSMVLFLAIPPAAGAAALVLGRVLKSGSLLFFGGIISALALMLWIQTAMSVAGESSDESEG